MRNAKMIKTGETENHKYRAKIMFMNIVSPKFH